MRRVPLYPDGPLTSALGFGCVSLTTLPSRREAVRLLEAAFAAGVTHFDTARAYGMGVSELILSEFLRRRRAEVTVTTKFGIDPPAIGQRVPLLGPIKRLLKKIPMLDRRVRRTMSAAATMGNFSPAAAQRTLEASLRTLRTDYIDLWLMHEAGLAAASQEDLLDYLDTQRRAGTIRAFGIGSRYAAYQDDCAHFPGALRVFQFENNVVHPNRRRLVHAECRGLITHSVFKHSSWLRSALARVPEAVAGFERATGLQPLDPATLHRLMLDWALHDHGTGVVLFASRSPQNIADNVAVSRGPPVAEAVLAAFETLIERAAQAEARPPSA